MLGHGMYPAVSKNRSQRPEMVRTESGVLYSSVGDPAPRGPFDPDKKNNKFPMWNFRRHQSHEAVTAGAPLKPYCMTEPNYLQTLQKKRLDDRPNQPRRVGTAPFPMPLDENDGIHLPLGQRKHTLMMTPEELSKKPSARAQFPDVKWGSSITVGGPFVSQRPMSPYALQRLMARQSMFARQAHKHRHGDDDVSVDEVVSRDIEEWKEVKAKAAEQSKKEKRRMQARYRALSSSGATTYGHQEARAVSPGSSGSSTRYPGRDGRRDSSEGSRRHRRPPSSGSREEGRHSQRSPASGSFGSGTSGSYQPSPPSTEPLHSRHAGSRQPHRRHHSYSDSTGGGTRGGQSREGSPTRRRSGAVTDRSSPLSAVSETTSAILSVSLTERAMRKREGGGGSMSRRHRRGRSPGSRASSRSSSSSVSSRSSAKSWDADSNGFVLARTPDPNPFRTTSRRMGSHVDVTVRGHNRARRVAHQIARKYVHVERRRPAVMRPPHAAPVAQGAARAVGRVSVVPPVVLAVQPPKPGVVPAAAAAVALPARDALHSPGAGATRPAVVEQTMNSG